MKRNTESKEIIEAFLNAPIEYFIWEREIFLLDSRKCTSNWFQKIVISIKIYFLIRKIKKLCYKKPLKDNWEFEYGY